MQAEIRVGKSSYEGRLIDSVREKDGARVSIELLAGFPILLIGESVSIVIKSDNQSELPAKLIFEERGQDRIECHLKLSSRYAALANSRQSLRVRPSADSPVSVRLVRGVEAVVHDVSVHGIALIIPQEDQAKLTDQLHLSFDIRLPGITELLRLKGLVRHRRLLGSAVLYGVQFDSMQTDGFNRKQALLNDYVMRRQSEMLRKVRGD